MATELLLSPFLDPSSRTFWGGLVVASVLGIAVHGTRGTRPRPGAWLRASSLLDLQLLVSRQLLRVLGVWPVIGGGAWIATHLVRLGDRLLGVPEPPLSGVGVVVAYTVVTFVAWDASRYVLHRLMHEVPILWRLHQVHHSATVLTPLTFHRIHPLESLLYGVRGVLVTAAVGGAMFWLFRTEAVVWTVLGVHGVGFVCNVATGNLRHSHVWLTFGPLEGWILSPAQHQLHHARDAGHPNYGTWLAIFDRLGGTLVRGTQPPAAYGLSRRNHGDDLWSAWFGPLGLGPRRVVGALAIALALGVPQPARGQDEDQDDADIEIIVTDEGTPQVAGSAYVLGEEALDQFEHDDIHAVLGRVPGVYVRGEEGFGLRPNIGIRGASADRSAKITLLEDGVLLGPAPYSAPAAYYFPMVTRMVAVEVFKGPSAIQHGPHTVGGAVNLQTRGVPAGPAGAVDLGVGLRQTGKIHLWAGTGGPRWGILAEGVGLHSGGFKHLDGGGPTGFDRTEVMLKARVGTDPTRRDHTALELKLGYAHETSHETYLGLHPDDYAVDPFRRYAASQLGRMVWDRTQIEVAWPVFLGPVTIRTVAYHHGLDRSWTKFNRFADGPDVHALLQQPVGGQSEVFLAILRGEEDSTTEEQTLRIGTNDRQFGSMGVQTRARWHATEGAVDSRLEVGVRVHTDFIDRLHTEDPYQMRSGLLVADDDGQTEVILDGRSRARAVAVHAHEDLGIGRLRWVPGVRVESIWGDREDRDTGPVHRTIALPGMGVLYEVGAGANVFAGVHRGFSPVPPGEPAEVEPESSINVEAGARASTTDRTYVEGVAYLNDYVNLTGQCTISGGCTGTDLDQQFNGGRVWVYGAEAVLGHEIRLGRGLSMPVEGSMTWTESRFRTGFVSAFPQFGAVEVGDALPYVPRLQGSLNVALVHDRGRVGVAATGRSAMLDEAGPLPVSADTGVPALLNIDVAADLVLSRHFSAYANATNVTGVTPIASWRPFGARPTAPFQATVGLKGHLGGAAGDAGRAP